MNDTALRSINAVKYERLLPRCFPGALAFELTDRAGGTVWCFGDATFAAAPAEKSPAAADECWSRIASSLWKRRLDGGMTRLRCDLYARAGAHVASLFVTFDTSGSTPLALSGTALERTVRDVAAFIQDEYELQAECDQLAIELSERYEELNLVYATRDQIQYIEEGQEALEKLVKNCADYLEVSLAALMLRDRDVTIHSCSPSDAPPDIRGLIEKLKGPVYDLVESRVEGVVLNDSAPELRERLLPGRGERLLALPVVDNFGAAIGVLATVIASGEREFTNSDRNLIEVMAKKAGRIIQTHHDALTGLMNRSGFESHLISMLATARSENRASCVIHFDIGQLHAINDLMGHHVGDDVIRQVAKLLRKNLRDSDVIARIGGDEFGILLADCTLELGAAIAEKLAASIADLRVSSGRHQLDVTINGGIAPLSAGSDGIVGVLASAEIACKSAREAGRNRVEVFRQDNTSLVRRSKEIEWVSRLQQALRDDDFRLFAQRVQPLADRGSTHYEVLLRLHDGGDTLLAPGEFMPAAERYQLMPMIDRWVVKNTLATLGASWPAIGAAKPVFCINLSGQSLSNRGFTTFLIDELNRSGLPLEFICFEITETAAIANFDEAIELMTALRRLGCRFSLDDFGAGLSSFGYLKALPVDYLKIDGSFVRDIVSDSVSLSMVRAIAQIGRIMGLQTVAEFVEDAATLELLKEIGVDYGQGYGIARPTPIAGALESLRDNDARTA